MLFRLLTTQLLVLSYGFIRNYKISFYSRQFHSTNFIVNQNGINKLTALNIVCIERPSNSDDSANATSSFRKSTTTSPIFVPNIPEKYNDLPVKKKKFYGAKVGNGRDNRMNETNYHETVAKMKDNMYKMSILNQLENKNINIHDKIALYNKYQSDYVDKNYTPNKEGSDLFERWLHPTYFFDGTN